MGLRVDFAELNLATAHMGHTRLIVEVFRAELLGSLAIACGLQARYYSAKFIVHTQSQFKLFLTPTRRVSRKQVYDFTLAMAYP